MKRSLAGGTSNRQVSGEESDAGGTTNRPQLERNLKCTGGKINKPHSKG